MNTPDNTATTVPDGKPDGRVLRGLRNKDALLRAYTELLAEGDWQPRAIASRSRCATSAR